jgi:hypothetical protein
MYEEETMKKKSNKQNENEKQQIEKMWRKNNEK